MNYSPQALATLDAASAKFDAAKRLKAARADLDTAEHHHRVALVRYELACQREAEMMERYKGDTPWQLDDRVRDRVQAEMMMNNQSQEQSA